MASDDESDVEEVVAFEIESSKHVQKYRPIALEDLLKQTKFTRQEIRVMYRGFKQGEIRVRRKKGKCEDISLSPKARGIWGR
ncbi:hypothetical protein M8J76_004017 [Diaphorina citri]|nr:hypothetical protein M8J76_004017 [Diaphorina citri]